MYGRSKLICACLNERDKVCKCYSCLYDTSSFTCCFFHNVLYKQALTKMILLIYTTSNSINIMPTLRKTTIENPDLILYYNFMSLTIK